jgi:aspartyl-tRNA(Asn)/glutamyl-tRNA(Gln) amidotransferase subunit A
MPNRRQASSLEIVRECLRRIDALDGRLHSVLRVNPRAEEEARRQDEALAGGGAGPLVGLPVAIKDNILTAGLETTCGSRILEGFVPPRDATAVARLKAAGAVVLCKTNLDEFAMGSSTENSAFGPTRNPTDPERVPGARAAAPPLPSRRRSLRRSSGRTGSPRQPPHSAVVGLKPTYGRVSRSGLVAFGSSLDQIGTLARSVSDTARVLLVLAGADPRDSTSSALPVPDYVRALEEPCAGQRVGIPREYLGAALDPEIERAVREAAARFEEAGARVEEVSLPHTRYSIPTYYLVATAEASSNLARYDGVRYGLRAAADGKLRAMMERTRGAGLGPGSSAADHARNLRAFSAGYHDVHGKAQRVRTLLRRDFSGLRPGRRRAAVSDDTDHRVPARRKVDDPLAMYLSDVDTATVNLAGLPAISVPVGLRRRGFRSARRSSGRILGRDALRTAQSPAGVRSFPPGAPRALPS